MNRTMIAEVRGGNLSLTTLENHKPRTLADVKPLEPNALVRARFLSMTDRDLITGFQDPDSKWPLGPWKFDIKQFSRFLEEKCELYSHSIGKISTRQAVVRLYGYVGERLIEYLLRGDWSINYILFQYKDE